MNYEQLSDEIGQKVALAAEKPMSPYAFRNSDAIRRNPDHDKPTPIRPPFIRDTDKIMHCPYYNRYADKTQVFSLYKNDDLSRRSLHVQLVSRIARTLGRALDLNLELIEAMALGHDIGHTPFAHAGERYLNDIFHNHTGLYFSHNIQSVRVLDRIFPYNITLQTLDGIACHNGELELAEYRPRPLTGFEDFDAEVDACLKDSAKIKELVPSTLEGCIVRISDIIAYLGKDRQDAEKAKILTEGAYSDNAIGTYNAEIINNIMVNIVENSFGKPYIKMDSEHFEALRNAKKENYSQIYLSEAARGGLDRSVRPMMEELYEKLLSDLKDGNESSPVFRQHINYLNRTVHYSRPKPYEEENPDLIVADYIASMTDDYFIDLYRHLFPESGLEVSYIGYFG